MRTDAMRRADRDYRRRIRADHPERDSDRVRRASNRNRLAELKLSRGCQDCPPGTPWPAVALDFDHVRDTKIFGLAAGVHRPWACLQVEIEKCEVVCANHHRIRTEQRKNDQP